MRVGAEPTCQGQKLDDIDAALAALDLTHIALRFAETRRQGLLGHTGIPPRGDKQTKQEPIGFGEDGFCHWENAT